MVLYNIIFDKLFNKILFLKIINSLFYIAIFINCVVLFILILLQRGEEGVFQKTITTNTYFENKDLRNKTIYGLIILFILLFTTNIYIYWAHSRYLVANI